MKKVLVVTYYWPPAGGGGVQRWLKFVKFLRSYSWEPIVYTVENPEYAVQDDTLRKDIPENIEIIKHPIWEPYHLYKKFTKRKKNEGLGAAFASAKKTNKLKEHIANWVRSNFFIPDARRFWIKPSIKYLTKYLSSHPVDVLVTTGPPHSLHLIGYGLKRNTGIKWIADFRDPWTNIDYYKELKLTCFADRKHHYLEQKVIKSADAVMVVGNHMKQEFSGIRNEGVEVITNGFDEDDFGADHKIVPDSTFSLVHIGVFMKHRNPENLWSVLNDLCNSEKSFKEDLEIKLVGNVDNEIITSIRNHGLMNNLNYLGYQSHETVNRLHKEARVLLLLINKTGNARGMLTGKFFEYLAAKRPILAIGPEDGDVAEILDKTNAGLISGFDDDTNLRKNILHLYKLYKENRLFIQSQNIEQFSRNTLTYKLSRLLDEVVLKG